MKEVSCVKIRGSCCLSRSVPFVLQQFQFLFERSTFLFHSLSTPASSKSLFQLPFEHRQLSLRLSHVCRCHLQLSHSPHQSVTFSRCKLSSVRQAADTLINDIVGVVVAEIKASSGFSSVIAPQGHVLYRTVQHAARQALPAINKT